MKRLSLSTLAILAAATFSLQAEAPRYGVQGLVNIPLGDLKDFVDSKPGPGVGVHGTFDLGAGHMLRPRLDFTIFPEARLGTDHHKANVLSLGGDYLYFVAGKPEGLYLTAGISGMRWSFDTQDGSWNTTKLGVAIGAGYQWNATVGTEGRFVRCEVANGFQADVLQAGVTIRF